VLIGFGLVSLAVAVPFLWRGLAWKRLLAYSSLEHMGVLALGIGFGSRLALAGVTIHVAGHGVAKALGFYAATPLIAHDRRAAGRPVTGIARTLPPLGATLGISLGTLAAIPPSPLFASEVLIVAGGFESGRPWAATATAALLALGFLGLGHALLETLVGRAPRRPRVAPQGLRPVIWLTAGAALLLLGLTAVAPVLPESKIVDALVRGLS
jgi:hydrogenase-4 component F